MKINALFGSSSLENQRAEAGGAVMVEFLIAYLPVLISFLMFWQLGELVVAQMVVDRASSAAGRAAIVVLPDDPAFYDGDAQDVYSGSRERQIRMAAGMILQASPHLSENFSVDVSNIPTTDDHVEEIGVDVTAEFRCQRLQWVCGIDGMTILHAASQHTYQGARYEYEPPDLSTLVGNSNTLDPSCSGSDTPNAGGKGNGNGSGGSNGVPKGLGGSGHGGNGHGGNGHGGNGHGGNAHSGNGGSSPDESGSCPSGQTAQKDGSCGCASGQVMSATGCKPDSSCGAGGNGAGTGAGNNGASIIAKGKGSACPVVPQPACPKLLINQPDKWPSSTTLPNFPQCTPLTNTELEAKTKGIPMTQDVSTGSKTGKPYGTDIYSQDAFDYRCKKRLGANKNVAVLDWHCKHAGSGWVENTSFGVSESSDPGAWLHSEQNAFIAYEKEAADAGYELSECEPLHMYSERDSCYNAGGPSCGDWFTNGGQGSTKNPNVKTPPAQIQAIGQSLTWNFEYNNNYRYFDPARCGKSTQPPNSANLCKEIADGHAACSKLGISAGQCSSARSLFADPNKWQRNAADQKKIEDQYKQDLGQWQKEVDAQQTWKQGGQKTTPPPCKPDKKPVPPKFDGKLLDPTPANFKNADDCLKVLALEAALKKTVNKDATEAIKIEMQSCP